MKQIILLSTCALLLAGCSLSNNTQSQISNDQSLTSSVSQHDYSEVSERFISWNEIFSMPEDFYYVYFYSLTCSHCNEIKDEVIECVLSMKKAIYIVQESSEFNYTDNSNKTIGATSCENFAITGFPTVVSIDHKVVASNNSGTTAVKKALNL